MIYLKGMADGPSEGKKQKFGAEVQIGGFPVQNRKRSLMTKAYDPGRLSRSILQTPPIHSSLLPQLISLTDTKRLQQRVGNEEKQVKEYLPAS